MGADMPTARIRFRGEVEVQPFRRGTYLDREHLDGLIERALADRYRFGAGWKGFGVVSITLYDEDPGDGEGGDVPP
jgi:hypothetical protein